MEGYTRRECFRDDSFTFLHQLRCESDKARNAMLLAQGHHHQHLKYHTAHSCRMVGDRRDKRKSNKKRGYDKANLAGADDSIHMGRAARRCQGAAEAMHSESTVPHENRVGPDQAMDRCEPGSKTGAKKRALKGGGPLEAKSSR